MPGGWWSAAYLAAPVTLSTPSRRVSGCPMLDPCRTWAGVCVSAISTMVDNSRNGSEGGTRQGRHSLGRAGRSERERPHNDPSRELDLVGIVAGGFCLSKRGLGRAAKERRGGRCADQDLFCFPRPPRLHRHAAERKPRIRNRTRLEAQSGGGRDDGEGIGRSFADFQVAGMGGETRGFRRQSHRDDHLAGLKRVLTVRRIAGQAVEQFERNFAPPRSALNLDNGVERSQGDAEIGGMRRDAALAPSQYGVQPVVSTPGIAARARTAFVAGAGDIVEIRAARPLNEIAADGGGIAKLR